MSNFSVSEIILMIGIAQGIFLAMILLAINDKNASANRILSLQLILACLMLILRIVIPMTNKVGITQLIAPVEAGIFLFGPLGWLYIRRLLTQGDDRASLNIYHFLPAIIYGVMLLYISIGSSDRFIHLTRQSSVRLIFSFVELAALVSNIYYWYLSYRLVRRSEAEGLRQLSFEQDTFKFIRVLIGISGVVLAIWAVSYISTHILRMYLPLVNYNAVWIAIPITIYIIGYYALRQPELFRVRITPEEPHVAPKTRLQDEDANELRERLEHLMTVEKIYLDNELTLTQLADRLATSTNNLSWLLNNVFQSSFYDYVNGYRIKEFVSKVKDNEHETKTILSLSMDSGFNSKSTFNKAFKTKMGETPSSYIRSLRA